jgi:hypothetical protein
VTGESLSISFSFPKSLLLVKQASLRFSNEQKSVTGGQIEQTFFIFVLRVR